jgi:hypothetical protein
MGVVCYFNHVTLQDFQNRAGLCAYELLQDLKTTYKNPVTFQKKSGLTYEVLSELQLFLIP